MVRGLYTAATGMAVQREKMNVLTNNLVNAETTGFKKDSLISASFKEVIIGKLDDSNVVSQFDEVGPYNFGTHVDFMVTDFSSGALESTGNATDLAIAGSGFFAVETPEGELYTRSGSFSVDADGYLVTQDGNYVLGENGRIQVGSDSFSVSADGTVTTEEGVSDKLKVVSFENTDSLRKQGDNLYYTTGDETPAAADSYAIKQGYQEGSNVDLNDEMVNMLSVYRTYEAAQKILTMTDDTVGQAVNLGSLGGGA